MLFHGGKEKNLIESGVKQRHATVNRRGGEVQFVWIRGVRKSLESRVVNRNITHPDRWNLAWWGKMYKSWEGCTKDERLDRER